MKIVTHSGNFHADDVFAVATLLLLKPEAKVERTREAEKITKADIALDVGGVYNPEIDRFDHHQGGGAGVRQNGIPYAAFGLIWKKYGSKLAGELASQIDKKIVAPIDAIDNGVSVSKPLFEGVESYDISAVISSYLPEEGGEDVDECFMEAVQFAKGLLAREIVSARGEAQDAETLRNLAMRNAHSPVLVLDKFLRGKDALVDFPGILFVVFPGREEWGDSKWYIKTIRKSKTGFESKKLLPVNWAGKSDTELAKETGVSDAVFCHKGRFLAAAVSKGGALELAKKALEA